MTKSDDTHRLRDFQETVWEFFATNRRDMPWRSNTDPYWVMVSEIMLQQTQVGRVIPKFEAFIERFPTIEILASANLGDVLALWSGLGYNRRAQYLLRAAQTIVREHNGKVPEDIQSLTKLPGIGPNTAGAIAAYSYNQPAIFIETNIRSVFLHHFFPGKEAVADSEIRLLLIQTLDRNQPREWYWALMDYGAHLKQTTANPSRNSKHYTKQSRFEGSNRQMRGKILKLLLERPYSLNEIEDILRDGRTEAAVLQLVHENLLVQTDKKLHINNL